MTEPTIVTTVLPKLEPVTSVTVNEEVVSVGKQTLFSHCEQKLAELVILHTRETGKKLENAHTVLVFTTLPSCDGRNYFVEVAILAIGD